MTPLIQEMVALAPDVAIDFHWFDMSPVYTHEAHIDADLLGRPLPFPMTALVCRYDEHKILLLVKQLSMVTGVAGWVWDKHKYSPTRGFTYIVKDGQVLVRHADGTPFDYRTSSATNTLAFVAVFLQSLDTTPATGYAPAKRPNHAKKIRQGKPPSYDWTTVTIQPSKPRSDPQGGSHASPRWHERRGHWRIIKKTGKKVWVKNCEVGDKTKGAVFHDYRITNHGH